MFGYGQEIGIDLGTSTVLVHVRGKGVVLNEPSVVAVDSTTKKILAVGSEAQQMLGRTPGNIIAIRPLKDGVISDYNTTERMLHDFLAKVYTSRLLKPSVVICVPCSVTEVEERAVIDAAESAGARRAYVIEEPVAAALGAGIDVTRPVGNMVIDIGGGTTDVAVISLGGIVVATSIKVAGDKFDDAIVRYVRKKHSVAIGERTAEELKMNIGCVFPMDEDISMEVRGRSLVSGLPKSVTILSSEIMEALTECVSAIISAVHETLERTPPELVGDVSSTGITLTGGGSLIYGLDRLLQRETGISVRVADDAISCVVHGTGKALENMDVIRRSVANRTK